MWGVGRWHQDLGTRHYMKQGADSLASQSHPCFGTKRCLRLWTLYVQQCINESPEGLRFKNKRVSNSSFPAFSLPPLSSVFFDSFVLNKHMLFSFQHCDQTQEKSNAQEGTCSLGGFST